MHSCVYEASFTNNYTARPCNRQHPPTDTDAHAQEHMHTHIHTFVYAFIGLYMCTNEIHFGYISKAFSKY